MNISLGWVLPAFGGNNYGSLGRLRFGIRIPALGHCDRLPCAAPAAPELLAYAGDSFELRE